MPDVDGGCQSQDQQCHPCVDNALPHLTHDRIAGALPEAWVEAARKNETLQKLAGASRDRAKMVDLINDVSKTVRLPFTIPAIAPLDDLLGSFSKELTRQSKDLFVLSVVASVGMLFALVMGQLKHVLQLCSLSLALKNAIVAACVSNCIQQVHWEPPSSPLCTS